MTTDVENQKDDAAEQQGDVENQEHQDTQEGGQHDNEPAAVSVVFGDEEPPEEQEERRQAPEWVRELRKQNREYAKKIRELEAAQAKPAQAPADDPGKKPSLEDFDYETDKYEQALADWFERKRTIESRKSAQEAEQREAEQAWQAKLAKYETDKQALAVPDFEDYEDAVRSAMTPTQIGILMQGADKPAELVAGLGANQAKLKELAAIKDPVKFAFAVARLETQVRTKEMSRKPPAPEKPIRGNAPPSGSVDSVLDRLRAEAEKTGDYSKVHEYKRKQRAKA